MITFSKFPNIEKNIRYKSFTKNGNMFYNYIAIESINICNLNCIHCNQKERGEKKTEKSMSMSIDMFKDILNQCCDFGFTYFSLTPMNGEVFLDKTFIEKLDILENHPNVDGYHFYTNLTIDNNKYLDKLLSLKKISWLGISCYGLHFSEFERFARSTKTFYLNFKNNLKYLIDNNININLNIPIYTKTKIHHKLLITSETYKLLFQISRMTNSMLFPRDDFCSRRSLISNEVLESENFKLTANVKERPKMCQYFLTKNFISSTGIMIGCGCSGDIYFKTKIGNLNIQKLDEVYSSNAYLNLSDHEHCKVCNSYEDVSSKDITNADPITLTKIYEWRQENL